MRDTNGMAKRFGAWATCAHLIVLLSTLGFAGQVQAEANTQTISLYSISGRSIRLTHLSVDVATASQGERIHSQCSGESLRDSTIPPLFSNGQKSFEFYSGSNQVLLVPAPECESNVREIEFQIDPSDVTVLDVTLTNDPLYRKDAETSATLRMRCELKQEATLGGFASKETLSCVNIRTSGDVIEFRVD